MIADASTAIYPRNPSYRQRLGLALGGLGVREDGIHRTKRKPADDAETVRPTTPMGAPA